MKLCFLASNFNSALEKKYGSVEYEGKKYILTDYADLTGALLPDHQRGYFEMFAPAIDEKGNEYILYWLFKDDGRELDMYNYNDVYKVEVDRGDVCTKWREEK